MTNWTITAVLAAVCVLCLGLGGFAVEPRGLALVVFAAGGCEALALLYRTLRPDPRLSTTLSAVAQLIILSASAGALSYAVAARGGPLWDASFAAADRALGVDWLAYADAIESHPWAAYAYGLAYDSLKLQLLAVPLALGFTGRDRALHAFVAAYAFAALPTLLLSGVMPALGFFPGQGIAADRFPHLAPRDVYENAAAVLGLRAGGLRAFALADLYGVISFPSFHAACGVLVAASLWPVRALRWPALALDGLMVAATPLCGGHYLVDVLAGVATAVGALAAARALGRRASEVCPVPSPLAATLSGRA